jgi:hypothetical protein
VRRGTKSSAKRVRSCPACASISARELARQLRPLLRQRHARARVPQRAQPAVQAADVRPDRAAAPQDAPTHEPRLLYVADAALVDAAPLADLAATGAVPAVLSLAMARPLLRGQKYNREYTRGP